MLDPEEILFAVREERSTLVKTEKQTYRTTLSLQDLEERLRGHSFFRTHRAYLVNIARVAEIHPWFNGAYELVLADKEKSHVPVSRAAAKRLREMLHF